MAHELDEREEEIITSIEGGMMLTALCAHLGMSLTKFNAWTNQNETRSVRVREARISAASAWDEKAETEIRGAADPFELQKARELAQHYRWRASKIAPRAYGDKLAIGGDPDSPLTVMVQRLTDGAK